MRIAALAALLVLVAAGCGGAGPGGLAVRQFRFGAGAERFVVVVAQRDGSVVARGSGPLRLRVDAGRYRVVARRGAKRCALDVDVHSGRTTEIQVAVVAAGCTLADELPE